MADTQPEQAEIREPLIKMCPVVLANPDRIRGLPTDDLKMVNAFCSEV